MKDEIRTLADRYAAELKRRIDGRVAEMEQDDRSHVLIYQVLGVTEREGKLIDVYQNKGRFLYKSVQGEYHYADAAWAYVKRRTGVNLLGILQDLAAARTAQHGQ